MPPQATIDRTDAQGLTPSPALGQALRLLAADFTRPEIEATLDAHPDLALLPAPYPYLKARLEATRRPQGNALCAVLAPALANREAGRFCPEDPETPRNPALPAHNSHRKPTSEAESATPVGAIEGETLAWRVRSVGGCLGEDLDALDVALLNSIDRYDHGDGATIYTRAQAKRALPKLGIEVTRKTVQRRLDRLALAGFIRERGRARHNARRWSLGDPAEWLDCLALYRSMFTPRCPTTSVEMSHYNHPTETAQPAARQAVACAASEAQSLRESFNSERPRHTPPEDLTRNRRSEAEPDVSVPAAPTAARTPEGQLSLKRQAPEAQQEHGGRVRELVGKLRPRGVHLAMLHGFLKRYRLGPALMGLFETAASPTAGIENPGGWLRVTVPRLAASGAIERLAREV